MGLLFVKVGLVLLLKNFNFEGLRKEELKYNTASVALLPQHGQGMMKLLKK